MADNVVRFPTGKSATFREAVDRYLDMQCPGYSGEDREEVKRRLVAVVDKYKTPGIELRLPGEAFPTPELAAMVKERADGQIAAHVQGVFGDMLTELIFLHLYSFSLEWELARRANEPSPG